MWSLGPGTALSVAGRPNSGDLTGVLGRGNAREGRGVHLGRFWDLDGARERPAVGSGGYADL
jgi:hypothetical protein